MPCAALPEMSHVAKQIRQVGRAFIYILPLVLVAVIFVSPQRSSEAACSDPF